MSLQLKTQNKRGNTPQWRENLGYIAGFKNSNTFIVLDAYEGSGEDYKQREEPLLRIESEGLLLFIGTFEELRQKLNK